MPSGADFKYQTGDTTEWRNKYYALVDYLIATGQSVADIEAYLAENSDFNPGSVPTALASLNAVAASTSDNAEYQITHGTAYTSFAPNMWFLVRMPSANTGAMTLKVDGLAAKDVYQGGIATAGGEFAADGVYLFVYDAGNDRFETAGPKGRVPTMQVFTSSGTWTKPAGCRAAIVEVQGAGGGGGAGDSGAGATGSGGGGGGYARAVIDVTGIASSTITIGAGGSGGTSQGDGSAGGNSSWADGTNTVTGNGGGGGDGENTGDDGGAGGTATGGDLNIPGGDGGNSFGPGNRVGGGSVLGAPTYNHTNNANVYGAGGVGGTNSGGAGSDGSAGVVIVMEVY